MLPEEQRCPCAKLTCMCKVCIHKSHVALPICKAYTPKDIISSVANYLWQAWSLTCAAQAARLAASKAAGYVGSVAAGWR